MHIFQYNKNQKKYEIKDDLYKILSKIRKNIENYNETYNFTKQYISSNDSSYIEKFNSHEEIQYKNKLDIDNLILQKKAELYENILKYNSNYSETN